MKLTTIFASFILVAALASNAFAWQSNRGFNGFADAERGVAIASDTISVGSLLVLDLSYPGVLAGELATDFETGVVVKRSPATAEVADTYQVVIGVSLNAAVPGQSVTYVTRGKCQILYNYALDSGTAAAAVAGQTIGASNVAGYVGALNTLNNSGTAATDLNAGGKIFRKLGIILETASAGLVDCWLDLRR